MDEFINVQPNDVVRSCVKIRMGINNFQLKAINCTVNVQKYDANNILIDVMNVFINDEEYAQWANDDDYIINLVLSKMGLTPASVEVASAE